MRSRPETARPATSAGRRRCRAAWPLRSTGNVAGCWRRRPAAILLAFRAADGGLIWRQPLGATLVVPPVPALDRLCLALTDGRLLAVELASGTTVWSRHDPRTNHGSAVPARAAGLRHDREHGRERRREERSRALAMASRRRRGRHAVGRRAANLLRLSRQHGARRRSPERQSDMDGVDSVASCGWAVPGLRGRHGSARLHQHSRASHRRMGSSW